MNQGEPLNNPSDDGTDTQLAALGDRHLLGEYELLREIGRGGMGIVFEARQRTLDKRVAIKLLPAASVLEPKRLQRFHNEARAAAQLQHPHIVPVYAVGCDRGTHFYAMQFIEGHNLAELIRHLRAASEHGTTSPPQPEAAATPPAQSDSATAVLPRPAGESDTALGSDGFWKRTTRNSAARPAHFREVARIGREVAEALHFAHEHGIIHRDIKPSNLLIDSHGHSWVADFGLAQISGEATLTATGDLLGTLRYMSPEQVLGNRMIVDQRTDVYSLGATLYELLTLAPVCDGRNRADLLRQIAFEEPISPRHRDPRIPRELSTIICKAIAKNPQDRYMTAAEMAEDLRRFGVDEPIRAQPPSLQERAIRWGRRHQKFVASAGAFLGVLCLVLMVAGGLLAQTAKAERESRQLAEQEKQKAEQRSNEMQGLLLSSRALLELAGFPGRAVALAIAGWQRYACLETQNVLQKVLDENHERQTLDCGGRNGWRIAWSPNSQWIATTILGTTSDPTPGALRLWPALTIGAKWTKEFRSELTPTSAAFSPAGGRLLTTDAIRTPTTDSRYGQGGTPILWDIAEARELVRFPEADLREAHPLCFSPDSRRVILPVRGQPTARIYDAVEGLFIGELVGHSKPITYAGFSPRGTYIVTAAGDSSIRVWRSADRALLYTLPTGVPLPGRTPAFSSNERFLVSHTTSGLQGWEMAGGRPLQLPPLRTSTLNFALHGSLLVTASRQPQALRGIDLETVTPVFTTLLAELPRIIRFSTSGKTLALAMGNRVELRQSFSGDLITTLKGHPGLINDLQFASTSDDLLATISLDGTAKIWNVASGAQQDTYEVNNGPASLAPRQYSFSPLSDQFVVPTVTDEMVLFDWEHQQVLGRVSGRVEFDGLTEEDLLISTGRHRVMGWSISRREDVFSLEVPSPLAISQAHLTRDPRQVVVELANGQFMIWDPGSGSRRLFGDPLFPVWALTVSPNGRWIASSPRHDRIELRATADGAVKDTWETSEQVARLSFNRASDRLLATIAPSRLVVWNLQPRGTALDLEIPNGPLRFAEFSPRGSEIITLQDEPQAVARSWSSADGKLLREATLPAKPASLSWSQTRPYVLISGAKSGLWEWNYETGALRTISDLSVISAVYARNDTQIWGVNRPVFTTPFLDSQLPPVGSRRSTLYSWDTETGRLVTSVPSSLGMVKGIVSLSDGNSLLWCERYGAAVVDSTSNRPRAEIPGHGLDISDFRFSPRGGFVLSSSWDHTAAVWNAETGALVRRLDAHQVPVTTVAMNSEETELATGAFDGEVILSSATTGETQRRLAAHQGPVLHLLYASPSRRWLSNGLDGKLRIWDRQGMLVRTLSSTQEIFGSVELAPGRDDLLVVPSAKRVLRVPVLGPTSLAEAKRAPPPQPAPPQQHVVEYYRDLAADPVVLKHDAPIRLARWRHDGAQALALTDPTDAPDRPATVHIWQIASASNQAPVSVAQIWATRESPILDAFFAPSGTTIATLHSDSIRLWDVPSRKVVASLKTAKFADLLSTPPNRRDSPFAASGEWLLTLTSGGQLRRSWIDPLRGGAITPPVVLSDAELEAVK